MDARAEGAATSDGEECSAARQLEPVLTNVNGDDDAERHEVVALLRAGRRLRSANAEICESAGSGGRNPKLRLRCWSGATSLPNFGMATGISLCVLRYGIESESDS